MTIVIKIRILQFFLEFLNSAMFYLSANTKQLQQPFLEAETLHGKKKKRKLQLLSTLIFLTYPYNFI